MASGRDNQYTCLSFGYERGCMWWRKVIPLNFTTNIYCFALSFPIHWIFFYVICFRPIPVSPGSNSISQSTTTRNKYSHVLPQKYKETPRPCYQCGLVVDDQTRHVLNKCDKFKEQGRYTWRRNCVLHYLDTLVDHNKFRVFCDLPDRRTSSGKMVEFLFIF